MTYKMPGPSLYPNIQRSSHGYRIGHTDSKSKVIPGDEGGTTISMKEENGDPLEKGDIKGVGLTTGKTVAMKPGETHVFKDDSEVLETPMTYRSPLLEKKSKAKWRKDGTLRKVVTTDDETGYRSVITFDREGHIKSAKNNRTDNKHKKSIQRLSGSDWINEDMSIYSNDPSIVSTKNYGPKKKEPEPEETEMQELNRLYKRDRSDSDSTASIP
tara:strand:- start:40 stop:681 length:642 start_codon:yes stop_codon:yes gene_type:complete